MKPERASSPNTATERSQGSTSSRPKLCPRCGDPLRYPGVLDACLKCGYAGAHKQASSPVPRKPTPSNALLLALGEVPPWVWALAGGCVVVLAFCTFASIRLPARGFERALVATALLGVGFAGAIAAEIWVIPLIAFDAPLLSVLDFIVPFRLWSVAMGKLPRTHRPVCLLSWCVTAMVGGLLIVGGLWYWLPGKHKDRFRLESAVASAGSGTGGSSEEVYYQRKEVAPKDDPSPRDEDDPDEAPAEKTTLRCVVLGYIPEKDGLKLVLGIEEKGKVRYAGVVRRGLNPANTEQVQKRLALHARLEPPLPDLPVKAIWVDPGIQCEVTQSGTGTATTLPNPVFKDLVPDPKQKDK